ncbi:lachesin-like isoform X2 [Orbicella faveolata]|uniref:lachesin-like isoform X2 n=1 Tax=Orbicella faveolata TaxID=48498 RepID=UPI0009E33F24|nr:lachesin-like isoform X2 [Orbicella faveolata]
MLLSVPASLTNVSRDQTVREDSNMKLFCEAIGKPTSNITWTRELEDGSNGEVLHQGSTWDFPKIKRTDAGTYKCTAYNGFGAKVSQVFKVNVTYPPIVFEVSATRQDVEVQESVSLECTAEGNPPPNYTWMPCNERVCHESKLVISEVLYDDVYVCTVTNSLGSDSGNVSIFIGGKVINVTLVITSESCTDGKYNQSSLWTKLEKTIDEVFANESRYTSVQLRDARCGSVTTDLVLKFSSTIQERQVIDILRNAAKNGMLGELNVNVSSIIGTRPTVKTTTTAAATTPSSPSDSKMGIILIAVLVPLVSLLVTAGVAAWCMYRKRKCKRRETKVHNNGFNGEAGNVPDSLHTLVYGGSCGHEAKTMTFRPLRSHFQVGEVQEQAYVQVTSGCEGRPNRHSGGGNPSSVPPVLYDTAQNGNRGADKAQYAVVDKFKGNQRQGGQRSYLSYQSSL